MYAITNSSNITTEILVLKLHAKLHRTYYHILDSMKFILEEAHYHQAMYSYYT
jgi:hypothetical protein